MNNPITSRYGNQIRVRVCGIAIKNSSLLLVKHQGLGEQNILWAPPGGGVEPGEITSDALKREFFEETGLKVEVNDFLFVNEFLAHPLHAIELFFEVKVLSEGHATGYDPEMPTDEQIIKEVRFVTFEEMRVMDNKTLHNVLRSAYNPESLLNMNGYFKFCQ